MFGAVHNSHPHLRMEGTTCKLESGTYWDIFLITPNNYTPKIWFTWFFNKDLGYLYAYFVFLF